MQQPSDKETYCAYCGERFRLDIAGATEDVTRHIYQCPSHPMAQLFEVLDSVDKAITFDTEAEAAQSPFGLPMEVAFRVKEALHLWRIA